MAEITVSDGRQFRRGDVVNVYLPSGKIRGQFTVDNVKSFNPSWLKCMWWRIKYSVTRVFSGK
jgi:hypothetical protein